jgi:hypothetical protein
MMEFAVETRGLARTFGSLRAVDGIDLRVPPEAFTASSARMAPESPPPSSA